MVDFNTDNINVKRIEIKKPVVKDGTWQIQHEVIEYTNDQQEEAAANQEQQ